MGITASQSNGRKSKVNMIIDDIVNTVSALESQYMETRGESCDAIIAKYHSELMTNERIDLKKVAETLGINVHHRNNKDILCRKIIAHYENRLRLLQMLRHVVTYCHNRHNALTTGPICKSNHHEFDKDKCSQWQEFASVPDYVANNPEWIKAISNIERQSNAVLEDAYAYINLLQDYGFAVTVKQMDEIRYNLQYLYNGAQSVCDKSYKLALDIRYNSGAIAASVAADKKAVSLSNARTAAYGLANGLPYSQPKPPANSKPKGRGRNSRRKPKGGIKSRSSRRRSSSRGRRRRR